MVDSLDPALAFAGAIILWFIYAWQCRRRVRPVIRLDCLDGRHDACETCDCSCHEERML